MGTDLITMAFVPVRQLPSTWASRSARALGGSYTLSEYCAARHSRGYVGMYLQKRVSVVSEPAIREP